MNPQFLPVWTTNKYVISSATNSQVGTYQTSLIVTLSANTAQVININTVTKVVMASNC